MPIYRKKPVEIEARELTVDAIMDRDIITWCGGQFGSMSKAGDGSVIAANIKIPTLEGVMRAELGDYIIEGVKGEFYPCKPDIFKATYERVS